MKIGVYKLEPYPNLAIEKIRIFHRRRGDTIVEYPSLEQCDLIYASSIFDYTPKETVPYTAITGGTGYDLTTRLPAEIDSVKPHLNYGFTTRGCIRNCPYCVVPKKEGSVYVEGDLLDLWDRRTKDVTLYDNNILALPEHFELICNQAIENKIRLDFNQGLDHRLITPEIAELMKRTSHLEYRLAFDWPQLADSVLQAIELLRRYGINRSTWYVLCGYDTTLDEDLFRLNLLRDNKQNAFVQVYRNGNKDTNPLLKPLAWWTNQHNVFYGYTWEEFLALPDKVENRYYKRLYDGRGKEKNNLESGRPV